AFIGAFNLNMTFILCIINLKAPMKAQDEPLYHSIYRDIASRIISGEYPENYELPTERILSEWKHVSRSTIRRALEFLRQDGYIIKVHGKGNFVKPHVFTQPLAKFYSFTDTLKSDGVIISNEILDCIICAPDNDLQQILNCPADKLFFRLTRLRSALTYPLMLETTYLPKSR
ncbi:MAG TPA: hypothetical protein DDZ66_01485, partial [Firmicutes bacterium]|nr:hypothetical protein [Bacillota bacterium]